MLWPLHTKKIVVGVYENWFQHVAVKIVHSKIRIINSLHAYSSLCFYGNCFLYYMYAVTHILVYERAHFFWKDILTCMKIYKHVNMRYLAAKFNKHSIIFGVQCHRFASKKLAGQIKGTFIKLTNPFFRMSNNFTSKRNT